jgi:hypothetical protein
VDDVARRGAAIRCLSSDCSGDRDSLKAEYQRYQAAYRDYRLLIDCVEAERRNSRRVNFKGFGGAPVPIPEGCPPKDVETAYLNTKGLAESLDERLFERGFRPLPQANSLQD